MARETATNVGGHSIMSGVSDDRINATRPGLWNSDIEQSVKSYNEWFTDFAPKTYQDKRKVSTSLVQTAFQHTNNLKDLTPQVLSKRPGILPVLRMSTLPPLAVDRLIGLATSKKSLVESLETGKLPVRMPRNELEQHLSRICKVIDNLLDRELLFWKDKKREPSPGEKDIAISVVSDRLSGAWADPILRNAQEKHQLDTLKDFLFKNRYEEVEPSSIAESTALPPGAFALGYNIKKRKGQDEANVPIDAIIQPHSARPNSIPMLVEAKSAGDYTNTNKRRKEESTKIQQLTKRFGNKPNYVLLLRGYFNPGYLGYEASYGFDWVWEHRIGDLKELGV